MLDEFASIAAEEYGNRRFPSNEKGAQVATSSFAAGVGWRDDHPAWLLEEPNKPGKYLVQCGETTITTTCLLEDGTWLPKFQSAAAWFPYPEMIDLTLKTKGK